MREDSLSVSIRRNYIPHQGAPPQRGRPPALWGNAKACVSINFQKRESRYRDVARNPDTTAASNSSGARYCRACIRHLCAKMPNFARTSSYVPRTCSCRRPPVRSSVGFASTMKTRLPIRCFVRAAAVARWPMCTVIASMSGGGRASIQTQFTSVIPANSSTGSQQQ